ncbi:TMEM43 family protein [Synergistaceae bacterium OttesenSCG-928-I11]|nr:TMEM43 family protein [Synergistaceae bacterium OttesenSCG-928-I11]
MKRKEGAGTVRIVIGVVILLLSLTMVFFGEKNRRESQNAISIASKVVVEMKDASRIDPSMNGKLVHVTGMALPQGEAVDPDFGVSRKAIKLARRVWFLQWTEDITRRTKSDGKEEIRYSYEEKWTTKPVDIAKFQNPGLLGAIHRTFYFTKDSNDLLAKYAKEDFYTERVALGAYELPMFIAEQLPAKTVSDMTPDTKTAGEIEAFLLDRSDIKLAPRTKVHAGTGGFYIGADPENPQAGDVKIEFDETEPAEISLIAAVSGNAFASYKVEGGGEFSKMTAGKASASEMLGEAESKSASNAWILRIFGGLMVLLSVWLIRGGLRKRALKG